MGCTRGGFGGAFPPTGASTEGDFSAGAGTEHFSVVGVPADADEVSVSMADAAAADVWLSVLSSLLVAPE